VEWKLTINTETHTVLTILNTSTSTLRTETEIDHQN